MFPSVKVSPTQNSGYIASLNVEKTKNVKSRVETVVILDRSVSMTIFFNSILTKVLPKVFNLLSYDNNDVIHLVTFDNEAEVYRTRVKDFASLKMRARGGTFMATAVEKLQELLLSLNSPELIRILTITDGDVFDQNEVSQAGAEVAKLASTLSSRINSQAVRLFTSSCQPDTTAICSLLQLNNMKESTLIDIFSSYDEMDNIGSKIAKLFLNDESFVKLISQEPIFYKNPWDSTATNVVWLHSGNNVFWFKDLPTKEIKIDDQAINITVESKLTLGKFHMLIDEKLDFIINQLKIMKVIGTQESSETTKKIVDYFEQQENFLVQDLSREVGNSKLRSRLNTMVTKRKKIITNILAELANDDKVSALNSAQKADYLRQVDTTKNSRGLAKRAVKEGLNFDEIARNEVLEIAKHIDELDGIDDSTHQRSFYSRETTLGGIKFLAEITENEAFKGFDVHDILELFNCVGVACKGPIGDYADPMTWKVAEVYLGCFVSVSDIIIVSKQSDGGLMAPAFDDEITSVIPMFEDQRIGKFLKKYAPSLLEYSCSVGMRRIIADVPMTTGYTICNGVWKMIEVLDTNKSTVAIETFQKLAETLDSFAGKYFDHINPHLCHQGNGKFSMFLGFNGTQDMIVPLFRIFRENDESKISLVPDILRSLFSHETWLGIRKLYKNQENTQEIAEELLHKLLGIDIEKFKTREKSLWEDEPELADIEFYDEPKVNYELVDELFNPLFYLKHISLMPRFLGASVNQNSFDIKQTANSSEETVLEALKIDYDYKKFSFFSVFQSLSFTTRSDRGDVETGKMKIVDLKNEKEAMKEVKKYIKKIYETKYLSDLAHKKKVQIFEMGNLVATKILAAETYDEMVTIWRIGVVRNNVTFKIETSSSSGFQTLLTKLCDMQEKVPQRKEIIKVLLLGVDNKESAVWNRGGVCFLPRISPIATTFRQCGDIAEWDEIMGKFKLRRKHIYRDDKLNRHGHGNEKSSYWAYGYTNLQEYRDSVSEEEFLEYCKVHSTCCGVRNLREEYLELII